MKCPRLRLDRLLCPTLLGSSANPTQIAATVQASFVNAPQLFNKLPKDMCHRGQLPILGTAAYEKHM